MFVKPCPKCGRSPKITEGVARNGHRAYFIGCPNFCSVLKPKHNDKYDWSNRWILINEDCDYNTLYKKWNEELIE
jgi:hypothetical protein